MAPVHVLDQYYLGITLLVTAAWQLIAFAVAWKFKTDKITDFAGGVNFLILALMTLLLGNTYCGRNVAVSYFVMIWAARLAGFLLLRVLTRGRDARFDGFRENFGKIFGFWIGQIVWVWVVSLPITILNSPSTAGPSPSIHVCHPNFGTSRDIAGVVLWGIGWSIEVVADLQKFLFKSTGPPPDVIMNSGLWRYSRHPPYFGEILCWWGIWIISISPATSSTSGLSDSAKSAQFGAVVSPILTMILLLFASGIPPAERSVAQKFQKLSQDDKRTANTAKPNSGTAPTVNTSPTTNSTSPAGAANPTPGMNVSKSLPELPPVPSPWVAYQEYIARTSILIPIPPPLYLRIPRIIKETVLLDWPWYRRVDPPQSDHSSNGEQEERAGDVVV
ncbi:DUF1295-domain-containing protein [Suillus clintonianus]|uniref:DUF1295-domain-containing protein n=1 Tax=Suillus clintonianus TaxID=1904413 RepID=UPI001B87AFD1|nr:DUF1295-domain-containing protein [Suillus clintonianus]KAG2153367.1 DUF1295-domain-containing protein [Suillus clintonianus]